MERLGRVEPLAAVLPVSGVEELLDEPERPVRRFLGNVVPWLASSHTLISSGLVTPS